jgi:osmoprotectant transport system ATP-binding protein
VIELRGVSKRYPRPAEDGGPSFAVRDVTLHLAGRELIALLGESGSGKTTLLRMVNRLVEPDAGEVLVDGQNVATLDAVVLRRRIGYVIQQAGLFPHLTVGDNVAVVPRLLGWAPADITARVDELLELVGLPAAEYRGRFPEQLSGGQRQRVGVARALAARPKVLLLDEPFGALDPITRVALQGELRRIHRELELTTIMVTHDLVEALTLADRIAVLYRGELRQLGTPHQLMSAPADEYVARLMQMARHQVEQLQPLIDSGSVDRSVMTSPAPAAPLE